MYLLNHKFINRTGFIQMELDDINNRFSRLFQSITWFTYRDNLEIGLDGTNIKSDAGWGCMLRVGQMILF